jgi:hypothetical protein
LLTTQRAPLSISSVNKRASAPSVIIVLRVIVSRAEHTRRPANGYNAHGADAHGNPDHAHAPALIPAALAPVPVMRAGDDAERQQRAKSHH